MKFFLTAFLFLMPATLLAHGGVEKSVGLTTVYLNQSPLSLLVGEKVLMTFVFADKEQPLKKFANLEIKIDLIDTYYGDESKDQIVSSEIKKTDANGAVEFSFIPKKENYFDIELTFTDPVSGERDITGFLVQPRATEKFSGLWIIGALIAGLFIGIQVW